MNRAFKELSEKAADFERRGEYEAAASCWLRAAAHSSSGVNVKFCEARSDVCKSRMTTKTA